MAAETAPRHGSRRSRFAEAAELAWQSSRTLARQARARYATDLIKLPHRRGFEAVWNTVEYIPGWFNEGNAAALYVLMQSRPPTTIVEIGSYLGRSTVFFAMSLRDANAEGRVVAVDPHTGDRQQLETLHTRELPTLELFRRHCEAAGVTDLVDARVMESLEAARSWTEPVDLLYVDGWHSYEAAAADGEAWLPHLSELGIAVFDDYVAYDEVRQAVDDLAARGQFRLWGSIFGQAVGGREPEPPAALRRALVLGRGGFRR